MDENPSKKKPGRRRLIGLTCSLLSFAVLTYIAAALISGRQPGIFRAFGMFSDLGSAKMADEFNFDVGRNRVFADMDGALAAAGTLGVQVLDAGGSETLRDPFRMSAPAIYSNNGRAVAFDIGGNDVRVFDKTEIVLSIQTNGKIISASINRNAWTVVCTQEDGISKGIVIVYNNRGQPVYKVTFATGYVLSAVLSPDNKSLAILNFADGGSRITFYDLNSEDVDRVFDLPEGLIIDIRYLTGGNVLAMSTDSIFLLDRASRVRGHYDFTGKRLGGFVLDGGCIALYLLDHGVGHRGRLVTLTDSGSLLGEIETDTEIYSISACDKHLAVLRSDGLIFFDSALNELPAPDESASASGAARVLALAGGAALIAGDHFAVIFRVDSHG